MKHMPALAYAILVPAFLFAQKEKMPWTEMTYAADGFAITVPYPPLPHSDPSVPDTSTYPIYLPHEPQIKLTLRVIHKQRDCGVDLALLKYRASRKATADGALAASSVDISSIKDVSIQGYPGLEYLWHANPSTMGLERYYCIKGQFSNSSISLNFRLTKAVGLPHVSDLLMQTRRVYRTKTRS
jgi:hypothetical protein